VLWCWWDDCYLEGSDDLILFIFFVFGELLGKELFDMNFVFVKNFFFCLCVLACCC
jgi:hypothetical protein